MNQMEMQNIVFNNTGIYDLNTPVITVGENTTTNTFNNNFGSTSVVATPAVNNTVVAWATNGNNSTGSPSNLTALTQQQMKDCTAGGPAWKPWTGTNAATLVGPGTASTMFGLGDYGHQGETYPNEGIEANPLSDPT
ncbi:MAG: hypothetical protein M0Z56_03635, partial [Desulfobacteraceae bacterium]|nr:hypothetical protein [Desulfobacteraceae bacterium]